MYNFFDFFSGSESDILFLIFSILIFVFLIVFAVVIINAIGQWKLYKKAEKNGWSAFIPIYNTYVGCQICGVNPIWIWIILGASFLSIIIPPLSFIGTVCSLYFRVIFSISMAKSFGKSEAFALGLIFLAPIFYLILGFGSSKYGGPTPMNDPILEMFGVNEKSQKTNTVYPDGDVTSENTNVVSANVKPKYCSNCGSAIEGDVNYCGRCGHKI